MNLPKLGDKRRALCFFFRGVWLVWIGALFAVAGRGQQSGALIAMVEACAEEAQEFESIHEPRYHTLWVVQDANGKLSVLATIPELIVPRRDGFWHVGVKQVCEFGEDEDGGNENLVQAIWAAPVLKAGQVERKTWMAMAKPRSSRSRTIPRIFFTVHPSERIKFFESSDRGSRLHGCRSLGPRVRMHV
jgi:hypothetical protein